MTLNQLLYVVEVSKTKSINATAHALFVSQSCVSTAIRELEDELGIVIFNRTNRGITITKDGETFIHYANDIIQQCKLLEEKYLGGEEHKRHFSVVMHHSTVAAKAFASVVKKFGLLDYEYSIYETNTLKLMLDLATYNHGEPVRLKDIAKRQNISEKYLEQIVAVLNKAALVKSIRGAHGGHVLNYPPEKYTVGQILKAVEGNMSPTDCVGENGTLCENKGTCVSYRLWEKLDTAINDVLEGITLADMLEWQNELLIDQYVI